MPEQAPSLEIACFSVESALIAIKQGVQRIELCGGPPSLGGLTPSRPDLKSVKAAAGSIPVHVMIRSRGGNFVYTDEEIKLMEDSIREFGDLADGFVFGALTGIDEVDEACCARLLSAAGQGRPCVFHRAVDEASDFSAALRTIQKLGLTGVLTSGSKSTASAGSAEIANAMSTLGNRLQIVVGGGVRSANLPELLETTGATWFHSSALVNGEETANADEIKRMLSILGLPKAP